MLIFCFFFQAEDGIRAIGVTGVQTCALPISPADGSVRVSAPGRGIPRREERNVAEVEIGIGKSGRRAYGFDDIAIVPSRRTRDPDDIDISWDLDAYHFELPLLASAMDGVVSPRIAVELGRLGGLGVLNLEGLWTRYEDPDPVYAEIASLPDAEATKRMQEIYAEPIRPELIGRRVEEIKAA